jgi:hypothetical protein
MCSSLRVMKITLPADNFHLKRKSRPLEPLLMKCSHNIVFAKYVFIKIFETLCKVGLLTDLVN